MLSSVEHGKSFIASEPGRINIQTTDWSVSTDLQVVIKSVAFAWNSDCVAHSAPGNYNPPRYQRVLLEFLNAGVSLHASRAA